MHESRSISLEKRIENARKKVPRNVRNICTSQSKCTRKEITSVKDTPKLKDFTEKFENLTTKLKNPQNNVNEDAIKKMLLKYKIDS